MRFLYCGTGLDEMAVDHMEAIKAELQARARFKVNDAVYWRGAVYHVVARYYRRWMDEIVYDLKEIVPPKKSFRFQKKVREKEMELWTMEKELRNTTL
ncbi:MAG: hypothetical protein KA941_11605 [Flavobacteriales bacterium]|nr:hypothetical protein [Flavobacteriales bacterium]